VLVVTPVAETEGVYRPAGDDESAEEGAHRPGRRRRSISQSFGATENPVRASTTGELLSSLLKLR
jgi:hypothetical protein